MSRIAVATLCLCCAIVSVRADEPALREGPGEPLSEERVTELLDANRGWLRPAVATLSYSFQMELVQRGDSWQAAVMYTAPDQVDVDIGGRVRHATVDNSYNPWNSAYPPKLITLLQGVTLFGPLHELAMYPDEHQLLSMGEEELDGRTVDVVHLRRAPQMPDEAFERWAEALQRPAQRPTYQYEFLPVEKEIGGVRRAAIEITCLHEEGPGWAEITAAHEEDPTQIKWGGQMITAAIRDYRGEERPVIVLGRDREFEGESPITQISFAGGVGNMTPKLTLGEGEKVYDAELAREKLATRRLAIRVGCGIWGSWYGYSGGGCQLDQLFVDRSTGMVVREEGFWGDEPKFTVQYGDQEELANGRLVPGHAVVTLLKDEPWVFDMRFSTLDGTGWLLESLKEYQNGELTATAQVSDATATPAPVGE